MLTRPGVQLSDPLEPLPVAAREDFCYDVEAGKIRHKSGNNLIFLKETYLDISSTEIRHMLAQGQSVRHLVAPAVADYIQEHGLYQTTLKKGSH